MLTTARLLTLETPAAFEAAVQEAVDCLRSGEVVGLPTETVYGLAANAWDAKAVAKIFQAKGRPSHNPLIVHVATLQMALECVTDWSSDADRLAQAFWPGPLTLVLPRSNKIPENVAAGGDTVAVRWPSHPFMQRVIRECGFPLAAPSANPSNAISPTSASHVMEGLGKLIPLIIDGGISWVGIESTVVDLSGKEVRILRPGMIDAKQLTVALGRPVTLQSTPEGASTRKSPGQLDRHYSPKARLLIHAWRDESSLVAWLNEKKLWHPTLRIFCHRTIPHADFASHQICLFPDDPEAYARALYAEMHRADQEGVEVIVVEALDPTPEWEGIADRLRRAGQQGS